MGRFSHQRENGQRQNYNNTPQNNRQGSQYPERHRDGEWRRDEARDIWYGWNFDHHGWRIVDVDQRTWVEEVARPVGPVAQLETNFEADLEPMKREMAQDFNRMKRKVSQTSMGNSSPPQNTGTSRGRKSQRQPESQQPPTKFTQPPSPHQLQAKHGQPKDESQSLSTRGGCHRQYPNMFEQGPQQPQSVGTNAWQQQSQLHPRSTARVMNESQYRLPAASRRVAAPRGRSDTRGEDSGSQVPVPPPASKPSQKQQQLQQQQQHTAPRSQQTPSSRGGLGSRGGARGAATQQAAPSRFDSFDATTAANAARAEEEKKAARDAKAQRGGRSGRGAHTTSTRGQSTMTPPGRFQRMAYVAANDRDLSITVTDPEIPTTSEELEQFVTDQHNLPLFGHITETYYQDAVSTDPKLRHNSANQWWEQNQNIIVCAQCTALKKSCDHNVPCGPCVKEGWPCKIAVCSHPSDCYLENCHKMHTPLRACIIEAAITKGYSGRDFVDRWVRTRTIDMDPIEYKTQPREWRTTPSSLPPVGSALPFDKSRALDPNAKPDYGYKTSEEPRFVVYLKQGTDAFKNRVFADSERMEALERQRIHTEQIKAQNDKRQVGNNMAKILALAGGTEGMDVEVGGGEATTSPPSKASRNGFAKENAKAAQAHKTPEAQAQAAEERARRVKEPSKPFTLRLVEVFGDGSSSDSDEDESISGGVGAG